MQLTPAILPTSYEELIHNLFKVEGVSKRVQIDLCDGRFGLEKTWLPYEEKELPDGFEYEFDLMVHDWEKYFNRVVALGAKRVIAHIDFFSNEEIAILVRNAKKNLITLGLVVSNDKDVREFGRVVKEVTGEYSKIFIQVMGIKRIGAQGQPFDGSVLDRIAYLKKECRGVQIQVDGSMNPETIIKVRNVGATGVVIGSYLFSRGDLKEKYMSLQNSLR